MINDAGYAHTDLAIENAIEQEERIEVKKRGGCAVSVLNIEDSAAEARYGKPRGRYVTVECGRIWEMDDGRVDEVSGVLADELSKMVSNACGREADGKFGVLVAGLGNDEITPDAIGPETVRRVEVTRHIRTYMPELFGKMGGCALSAVATGVLGQTGIETVELVRGAAENIRPDIIIAVDALAARSVARLATTVQLSDTGISPGSGIGNMRRAICKRTVGVPVIALGVPTVVNSSTLVCDALERAGVEEIGERLREVLEEGRDFFVSPKESDIIVKKVAVLLARAIGKAFGGGENMAEHPRI